MNTTDVTTEKKTRTPRNFDNILKGAMKLTLKEKVDLRNALASDIQTEVKQAEESLKMAKEIAGV